MEVIVGKLAGFCGGVINSVTKTENILKSNNSVYCLGELVHNKQVVSKLESKGLKIINNIEEARDGSEVIIRAHGVPYSVYEDAKRRNIRLFDLTCPKVLKIHEEAEKLKNDGYYIILVAQKEHPEAIGTISFCGENSVILESVEDIDNVIEVIEDSSLDKVAVISQTTFSVIKFEKIVNILSDKLKDKYELIINNTICSATDLRQKETQELAKKVNAMIVIGGKNSSNTKKLYEISLSECKNSYIIETVDDLVEDMSHFEVVGVMAGASTPKESIDEVVNYLKSC